MTEKTLRDEIQQCLENACSELRHDGYFVGNPRIISITPIEARKERGQ